jgi:hypothetical protein
VLKVPGGGFVVARSNKLIMSAQESKERKAAEADPTLLAGLRPTQAELLKYVSTRQISQLMARASKLSREATIGYQVRPASDWRELELHLQSIHQDVAIFMRGDKKDKTFFQEHGEQPLLVCIGMSATGGCAGRPYLACVMNQYLLAELRRLASVIGLDTKLDFLKQRFPTIMSTFDDAVGRGQLGSLALASREDATIVTILLQLLVHIVPCSDNEHCKHPSQLHLFRGGFGWYAAAFLSP